MKSGSRRALGHAERVAWLRLSRAAQVGPVTFFALLERFGGAPAALEALPTLAARNGRGKPLGIPSIADAEREIAAAEALGAQVLCACEPAYPESLAWIEDAPPAIIAGRNLSLFEKPRIAIVGARNASVNGRKIAAKLASDLAEAGLIVVSGLARGIDTAAHSASIDKGTIAVLAGGVDVVYPPENHALHNRIREQGCLVSEMPLGTEPMARHFPRRNRIISGLSPGVVVVEAARHSGSLITARLALEQGREVFAVPGSPLDPRAQGANNLIREGAVLTETAEDVLRALTTLRPLAVSAFHDHVPAPVSAKEPQDSELAEARRIILEALGPSPVGVDELVRDCQVSAPIVLTILLELELAGRLDRQPGQRVSLIS